MKRLHWMLGGAFIIGGLAGSQLLLRTADAQDGLPDISGGYTGTIKGKAAAFEPGAKPFSIKKTCAFSASLCGSNLSAEITPTGDDPTVLAGEHGNGHFWAFSGDADNPFVMTGHVNKTATKIKGTILAGHGEGTSDLTVSTVKTIE
jgi:hypothetical protein